MQTYRLSQDIKPLIWVECTVEKHSRSRTDYLVKARSQFKERSTANQVLPACARRRCWVPSLLRTERCHLGGEGQGRGAHGAQS